MTENRRIFLNIVATYGRSLYALVIGLFCGRWTLMVLGEVDYGLMGVVGGLTAFVTFLNVIMSSGVGRFYAISVGRSQVNESQGLEECHQWFTTAVVVHTIFPAVLMVIGYPIGEWAVREFLTIPIDRVESCIWVWRCVCISAFVGMISVPFTAWYGAKQEIAELTVYGFVTTTLNVVFLYYALQRPGDWLAPIALWNLALFIVPKLIICCRAGRKYRECKFEWRFVLTSWERIRQMLVYSGWLLIGSAADMLKEQGVNVLVNKYFGPRLNAAKAVGGSLSQHSLTLTSSLIGAFWPAIIGAYGAGETEKVKRYVYRVCRLATLLVLVFAIPLALEVDEVLALWLKTPPKMAAGICVFCMLYTVIDMTSCGYFIAAHATGKIREYQIGVGGTALLTLPCALLVVLLGGGIYWVMASIVALRLCVACVRVVLAQRLMSLGIGFWVMKICVPLMAIAFVTLTLGCIPRLMMAASFGRVVITTVISELAILPLSWFFLLGEEEKSFIRKKLRVVLPLTERGKR